MTTNHFDLSGRTALVTGATRGLGEVAAVALAKAGARVAVCGRSQSDIKRVTDKITELGADAAGFELDVLSKPKIEATAAKILERFGAIDILVNNAGVNHRVPVLEFPEEEWDRVLNTNLKGYFLMAQVVVPQMLGPGVRQGHQYEFHPGHGGSAHAGGVRQFQGRCGSVDQGHGH